MKKHLLIIYGLLLTFTMSACSSLFKDTTRKETIVVNQPKLTVAKLLYRQTKRCWATDYEEIRSAGDLVHDIFSHTVLGENSVRTKVSIKSIDELDGIHILSFYQHDDISQVPTEKLSNYKFSGPDNPIIELLVSEISKSSAQVKIHQIIGYEEGHDALNEVKKWLQGDNRCHKK